MKPLSFPSGIASLADQAATLCLQGEGVLAPDLPGLSRRRFVQAVSGLMLPASFAGMSVNAFAEAVKTRVPGNGPAIPKWPDPSQTRQIWIKRQETGESIVARYYENGRIRMDDYLAVCRILRDVKAGVVAHIDVELMDLMFAIQSWLVSWGLDIPMLATSGYRTLNTNSALEGSARNSLHMQGRAADVRMEGVPVDYLGRLAAIFSVGGVGFYTTRHFNHIDTGNVRYWKGR